MAFWLVLRLIRIDPPHPGHFTAAKRSSQHSSTCDQSPSVFILCIRHLRFDKGFEDCFAPHLQIMTKAATPNDFLSTIALQR